jgi:hypothetical protein
MQLYEPVILDTGCAVDLQIYLDFSVSPVGHATHWGFRTNINNELSPAELSPKERRLSIFYKP